MRKATLPLSLRFLFLLVTAFLLTLPFLMAQSAGSSRAVVQVQPPAGLQSWQSPPMAIPLPKAEPFFSFFLVWQGEEGAFEIRFSADQHQWSEWQVLHRDPHNDERLVSELGFAEPGMRFFQLRFQNLNLQAVECHFFNPGPTPAFVPTPEESQLRSEECPLPSLVERKLWCPAGNCAAASNPSSTKVSHLIVHHSAGTNLANDWAAIVRAIWDLHVNGNGWADVGYNYLIDPQGLIYTGRGNDVLGAHFCGHNTNTMGVCMLGTFTDQAPTAAALESLTRLLAWKSDERKIDPLGIAFHASSGFEVPNLAGHRDGCATECPGNKLYPLLPQIRLQVLRYQEEICREVATSLGRQENSIPAPVVFPNPGSGQLWIQGGEWFGKGRIDLEVYGADGRRYLSRQLEKTGSEQMLPLPVEGLPAGLYCLRLKNENRELSLRFVLN